MGGPGTPQQIAFRTDRKVHSSCKQRQNILAQKATLNGELQWGIDLAKIIKVGDFDKSTESDDNDFAYV
jgi:hypothetical protein